MKRQTTSFRAEFSRQWAKKMDALAASRDQWIARNTLYYQDLITFIRFAIPKDASVLEIGCGTGFLLQELAPRAGAGVDISPKMVARARKKKLPYQFAVTDVHELSLRQKFDVVILSDTIGYLYDIRAAFLQIQKVMRPESRFIVTFHNPLWTPILELADRWGWKMPSTHLSWVDSKDVGNVLHTSGFEVVKLGKRFLLPIYIPLLSQFMNRYVSQLPGINALCLTEYVIARPMPKPRKEYSVSIVIPARNEKGNIEAAIRRLPKFGTKQEIIFVEGHSTDGTYEEIQRVVKKYGAKKHLSVYQQKGIGKADAVRVGFAKAKNEVLMILDADLTVAPEDLPAFYEILASHQGEFVNGSRLMYPLEDDSMRLLNMFGNMFFSAMFSWLLNQRFKDTLCGTKVLFRTDWKKIVANREYFGDFDPFGDFDLIFGASKLNLKIVENPVRYKARVYGSTNISRFKHGLLLLRMVFFAMRKMKCL